MQNAPQKDPIVVIGAGVNGSAMAMALKKLLQEQNSTQEVILLDKGAGDQNPGELENSSGGGTRITRIGNAEHPALSYTASDGAEFYTMWQRRLRSGEGGTAIQKVAAHIHEKFNNLTFYRANGFIMSMPRVSNTTPFHGGPGNALVNTIKGAQLAVKAVKNFKYNMMSGQELVYLQPGFFIRDEFKESTDVYSEPPCFIEDERDPKWFPTGGTLFAEQCVALHLALFKMYGGDFRPRTEVKNIEQKGKGVQVTLANDTQFMASQIVCAANIDNNQFLPSIFQVKQQRNVVGFFKNAAGVSMDRLMSDGPNPMPSFITYFSTDGESADYEYGVPGSKDSVRYPNYLKAARENGAYGVIKTGKIFPQEKKDLYEFSQNLLNIGQFEEMQALECSYGVSRKSRQIWDRHPHMRDVWNIHNCDGGGFKNAVGGALSFAARILGLKPHNPNIDFEKYFSFLSAERQLAAAPNTHLNDLVSRLG